MSLEGKTIACFGDSTTWGDNGTGKGGPAISWTSHMAELTGAAKVLNFGVKGSRIGVKADRDDSFVERFGEHDLTSDVICLFGGVNDFCRNVPVVRRKTKMSVRSMGRSPGLWSRLQRSTLSPSLSA
jgi:lysophospholipase L1-like esterase